MKRREGAGPQVSVIQGTTKRNSVFIPIVLVVSLMLSSGIFGGSAPSAPQPGGMFEQVGKGSPLSSALGAASFPCSTLSYAGNPAFYFPIPTGAMTSLSMRFSPISQDTLKDRHSLFL